MSGEAKRPFFVPFWQGKPTPICATCGRADHISQCRSCGLTKCILCHELYHEIGEAKRSTIHLNKGN